MEGNNKSFEDAGFLVEKDMVPKRAAAAARDLLDELREYSYLNLVDPFSEWSISHRGDQGVFFDVYQRHPIFRELVTEKLLDSVEAILGKNFFIYDNSVVFKPKESANEVPWHQDFLSRENEPDKLVVWIPLGPVNRKNGTLKFIEGTHKLGRQDWHDIKGETHHERIKPEAINELLQNYEVSYAEMEAGDVLLFHNLVVHGSDRVNQTDNRYVFRVSFQSMDERIYTPRQSPIVMRGGNPEFLRTKYPMPKPNEKGRIVKLINRLGQRLIRI